MVGGEGLRHVVLECAIGVGRNHRRDKLSGRAAGLDGQAASEELDVVTQISSTEDNAQHGLDTARGVVVEGTAGDGNDTVVVGLEARLGDTGAEVVEGRGLIGQHQAGHVDAVAAQRDADSPGDEFARAALVVQPAVFLLAALGRSLRGSEGESRVVGEGDAREGGHRPPPHPRGRRRRPSSGYSPSPDVGLRSALSQLRLYQSSKAS